MADPNPVTPETLKRVALLSASCTTSAEDADAIYDILADWAKLKANVETLRRACQESLMLWPNAETDATIRAALAATEPNGTGAGAPDAAKAVGPQRLGPASASDTKGKP